MRQFPKGYHDPNSRKTGQIENETIPASAALDTLLLPSSFLRSTLQPSRDSIRRISCIVDCVARPPLHIMLVHLLLQIVHDISPQGRAIDPIQDSQWPKIPLTVGHHVRICPPCHAF